MKQHNPSPLRLKQLCKKTLLSHCTRAVLQQRASVAATPTCLRNHRKHLVTQILKRVPSATRRHPARLLQAASLLLALWGYTGSGHMNEAQAAVPEPTFQHQFLDGFKVSANAKPALVDIDGDGDLDAFIGDNLGNILFYRNNGTQFIPVFAPDVAGNPLSGVNVGATASPVFVDIDFDGDMDLFSGKSNGTIGFYRNNGTNKIPSFTPVAGVGNPLSLVGLGKDTTLSLIDIDGDGDLDAFIGDQLGLIHFYRNNGNASSPAFVADIVGNPLSAVTTTGYSTPSFADIDNDGDFDAFIGDNSGALLFFRNNGTAAAPLLAADVIGNPMAGYNVGYRSTPAIADIDGDGDMDIIIGDRSGNTYVYQNTGTIKLPAFKPSAINNPVAAISAGLWVAPVFADIDFDGDKDLFVGESTGLVKFYQNNGTPAAPAFTLPNTLTPLAMVATGANAVPALVDIDGDGDLDAFVGEPTGTVRFYRNNGSATSSRFGAYPGGNPLAAVKVANSAKPAFADIDADGDLDAFIGDRAGNVSFYRNNGSATSPLFAADPAGNPLAAINVGFNAAPAFIDIDGDGDLDLFISEKYGTNLFYRNNGTPAAPLFVADAAGNPLKNIKTGLNTSAPALVDIDADGDPDAFVGMRFGAIKFFENKAFQTLSLPANAGSLKISTTTAGARIPTVWLWSTPLLAPPAGNFPYGSINYRVTTTLGGTAAVQMALPSTPPVGFNLYKVDLANNYAIIPTTAYRMVSPRTIEITLTDGGPFDLDGIANGIILDPVTIGTPTAIIAPVTPAPAAPAATKGGCVLNNASEFDPSLLLMTLLSLGFLFRRRINRKSFESKV